MLDGTPWTSHSFEMVKRQGAPFEASWNVSPLLTLSLQVSIRLCSNLWIYKPDSGWLFGSNAIDCVWRLGDKTQGHFIAKRVGYLITQQCFDDVCPKPNLHSRLRMQSGYRPPRNCDWVCLFLHACIAPVHHHKTAVVGTHSVLLAFSMSVFTVCRSAALAVSLLHYPQMTRMLIKAFLFCFQICTHVLV